MQVREARATDLSRLVGYGWASVDELPRVLDLRSTRAGEQIDVSCTACTFWRQEHRACASIGVDILSKPLMLFDRPRTDNISHEIVDWIDRFPSHDSLPPQAILVAYGWAALPVIAEKCGGSVNCAASRL